ncbi:MAG: glycosyltransferase family 39 protein [Deltaproteobacteria bacterium]|nr:glycosyltransferase family 39 protein [Deltaproteobacteria bacterium]
MAQEPSACPQPCTIKQFALLIAGLSILVAFTLGAAWICAEDAAAGRISLSVLQPAVDLISRHGEPWVAQASLVFPRIGFGLSAVLILLAFICLIQRTSRAATLPLICLSLAISIQVPALMNELQWCIPLLTLLGILVLTSLHFTTEAQEASSQDSRSGIFEITVLSLIVFAGALLRLYALNQVPDNFEGELTPFSIGATSIPGMVAANAGVGGPWAPLGLLYYVPIWLSAHLYGTTIVSLRISSAIVGIVSIPLLYIFMRSAFNKSAALWGAFFFAMDSLHVGWSRTDVHPHDVTTWPTILLCLCTVKAFQTGKNLYFAATALLMGLTWHQYPSGQSAFLIPVLALVLSLFAEPKIFSRLNWRLGWLALGVTLWAVGLPVSYYAATGEWHWSNPFTLTGERALWANQQSNLEVAVQIAEATLLHSAQYIQGLFYRAPFLFHQDILPVVPPFHPRTFPWMLSACLIPASLLLLSRLNRRHAGYAVLAAWIVIAILPGALSKEPFPKRSATFYVALDCLVAVYVAWMLAILKRHASKFIVIPVQVGLASLCVAYFCFCSILWFSERQWKFGTPGEQIVADRAAPFIHSGTVVITDLWEDYSEGKILWLMLDTLANPHNRPNAWIFASPPDTEMWKRYACSPRSAVENLNFSAWPYRWSKLREQVPEIQATTTWSNSVYIFKDRRRERSGDPPPALAELIGCCPQAAVTKIPRQASLTTDYYIVECQRAF